MNVICYLMLWYAHVSSTFQPSINLWTHHLRIDLVLHFTGVQNSEAGLELYMWVMVLTSVSRSDGTSFYKRLQVVFRKEICFFAMFWPLFPKEIYHISRSLSYRTRFHEHPITHTHKTRFHEHPTDLRHNKYIYEDTNPLKTEFLMNTTINVSSYLAGNTLPLLYTDQRISESRCLLWKP
jgi:hypothetical protein